MSRRVGAAVNKELERIDVQLRRSFEGGAWHGPSVLEALDGVAPDQAEAHPIPGAHSMLDIVLHLTGTYQLVLRRLTGDGTPLSPDEDWPVAKPGGWANAVATLRARHAALLDAVAAFPPSRLDLPLESNSPYSAYTQFVGITQHDLYHAGQIVMLRKASGTVAPARQARESL